MDLNQRILKPHRAGARKHVLRCDFIATNNTLLSAYPWTGKNEIRPGSNQWVPVRDDVYYDWLPGIYPDQETGHTFAAQHLVNSNHCQGSLVGTDGLTVNATARTVIDIGSPARKIVSQLMNPRVDVKMDTQTLFRVPAAAATHSTTPNFWTVYHSAQVLRNTGTPTQGDPAMHYLNLWGSAGDTQLLAQALIQTELTWAPNTAYLKYDSSPRPISPFFVGHSVQPTTPNGFQYICDVAGTSGVLLANEPVWPTVVGKTITDGLVTPITWRCEKNINYQTSRQVLEIVDTGSIISVSFGGIRITAHDTVDNDKTFIGFWDYYSSAESKHYSLEAWI